MGRFLFKKLMMLVVIYLSIEFIIDFFPNLADKYKFILLMSFLILLLFTSFEFYLRGLSQPALYITIAIPIIYFVGIIFLFHYDLSDLLNIIKLFCVKDKVNDRHFYDPRDWTAPILGINFFLSSLIMFAFLMSEKNITRSKCFWLFVAIQSGFFLLLCLLFEIKFKVYLVFILPRFLR